MQTSGGDVQPGTVTPPSDQEEDQHDEIHDLEGHPNVDSDNAVEENLEGDVTKYKGKKKKLFELRLKMASTRHLWDIYPYLS